MKPGRRLLSATAAVGALTLGLVATLTANASLPPTPSGWSLVWSDDFTGAAGTPVNGANWLYDLGTSYPGGAANWGTGEIETMTNSTANVFQDGDGNCVVRAKREPYTDLGGVSRAYTSGRITTRLTCGKAQGTGDEHRPSGTSAPEQITLSACTRTFSP